MNFTDKAVRFFMSDYTKIAGAFKTYAGAIIDKKKFDTVCAEKPTFLAKAYAAAQIDRENTDIREYGAATKAVVRDFKI